MLATTRLRLAPEWDGRFTRMVVLSGVAHVAIVVLALVLTARSGPRPLPMVAYTVEITDPSALGGRLPPGRISTQPTPEAAAPAPAPGEPAAEQQPTVPEPPPAPAPEPEPVAKVEPPKPEPPKPDAVKIEPATKPEPPKPPPKPAAKPEPKPTPPKPVAEKPKPAPEKPVAEKPKPAVEKPKPAAEKPADKPPQATKPGGQGGPADADAAPKDAYAAAAERWRTKSQGQGLGGTDGGSGPIGTGGAGPGGGGQLVGLEFLAYRQQVITTVKGHWTNVVVAPGLVAAVRFQIAADGTLSAIRLERSSGNAAYDASVLRAVQRTEQLPPPPAKYAKEFGEFVIEFHSEESGGKGAG